MSFINSSPMLLEILMMMDDEASSLLQWLCSAYFAWTSVPQSRKVSVYAQRLYWKEYCELHVMRGTFMRRLRMSKESFDKLLDTIRARLVVCEMNANRRGGPIIPELCLYCTMRYLAGGSYLDICNIINYRQQRDLVKT